MEKDKTIPGLTGKPVPKPKSAKKQYELEKKRRMTKHLGKNVGGVQYSSDVNPYFNPRSIREEVELWVDQLVKEGYDLSEYTWDDMVQIYETTILNEKKLSTSGMSPENRRTRDELVRKYGPEFLSNPRRQSQSNTRSASMVSPQTTETPRRRKTKTKLSDVQIKENIIDEASHYFLEMGLNEYGVEILIEELGLNEFVDWVYDISEEYYLIERKLKSDETILPARSRRIIGGKGAAPRKFSDPTKKTTAGGKRRAARSAARSEDEQSETPRQARIKELRAKSATKAQEKQPKKGGILDRVAGAINRGIERHKAAVNSKGWQDTKKAANKLASGLKTAAIAAVSEEVELWVNSLLEEGYDLSEYSWDDMYEIYLNEAAKRTPKKVRGAKNPKEYMAGRSNAGKRISGDEKTGPSHYTLGRRSIVDSPTQPNERPVNTPRVTKDELNYARMAHSSSKHKVGGRKGLPENYNVILSHLLDEGFASDEKSAQAIVSAMSEQWVQSIVEAKVDKKLPEWKRSAARTERYGNPHGSLGSGPQRDRRSEHEERRGKKKD